MNFNTKTDPGFSKKKISENKKKPDPTSAVDRVSMLKKSEISFIFMGAALVTLIIFFIFFRPSGSGFDKDKTDGTSGYGQELEKRISRLEELVEKHDALQKDISDATMTGDAIPDIHDYIARVERVEAALTVKFDILTERLDHMDGALDDLKKSSKTKPVKEKKIAPTVVNQSAPVKSEEIKNKRPVTVSKTTPEKNQSVYYTVQKGDTLYNIGKKFDISVLKLKKINDMTGGSTIYIGKKIRVKE